jgi:hypothetical protein
MAKSTQNSKNIQKRWEKVGENLKESSKKVVTFSTEKSKKTNEINVADDTNVFRHARVTTDSDTDLEEEGETIRVSPPPPLTSLPRGREEEDGVRAKRRDASIGLEINCETICGPGFILDLKACELEVQMAGLPIENTKAIAEIVARDWIASKTKVRYPSAAFRQALVSRRNQGAIENARLNVGLKRAAQTPQTAQLDAAYERIIAKKKARGDA